MRRSATLVAILTVAAAAAPQSGPLVTRTGAVQALEAMTTDLLRVAPNGVLPGYVVLATGERYGREPLQKMGPEDMLLQPTNAAQQAGMCFLRAATATHNPLYTKAALSVGRSLVCAQRASGGWDAVSKVRQPCRDDTADGRGPDTQATLRDGTTQTAIDFLFDLDAYYKRQNQVAPAWLWPALQRGLTYLLASQGREGGWPQYFPTASNEYPGYWTFNDGAISETIRVLLRAYSATHDVRYLDAAKRGGDFIIRVQGAAPQAGWAQQYDRALKPAKARAYEPAAIGSEETAFAMNALLDLYAATGETRFAKPLAAARSWLEASKIAPDRWARLYEIGSNRPIYGDRRGAVHYALDEVPEPLRSDYMWQGYFSAIYFAQQRMDALVKGGLAGLRAYDTKRLRRDAGAAYRGSIVRATAIAGSTSRQFDWATNGTLSLQTFVEDCNILLDVVEGSPN